MARPPKARNMELRDHFAAIIYADLVTNDQSNFHADPIAAASRAYFAADVLVAVRQGDPIPTDEFPL